MHLSYRLGFILSTIVLLTFACGSTKDDAATQTEACDAWYDALDGMNKTCGEVRTRIGERAVFQKFCASLIRMPGSSITPAFITSCVAASRAATGCVRGDSLPACQAKEGSLPAGSTCVAEYGLLQCKSGECRRSSIGGTSECGTCSETLPKGAACDASGTGTRCAPSLVCSNGTCQSVPAPTVGEACETKGPGCTGGLYCKPTSMTDSKGVCASYPKLGEPCTAGCASGAYCGGAKVCVALGSEGMPCGECAEKLYCDRGASNTCKAIPVLSAGQACGTSGRGICGPGLQCPFRQPSTCVPTLSENAACKEGDVCGEYLSCKNGTCQFVDSLAACK
jgi:hypothetical protein